VVEYAVEERSPHVELSSYTHGTTKLQLVSQTDNEHLRRSVEESHLFIPPKYLRD
jgi:hypothetical protein